MKPEDRENKLYRDGKKTKLELEEKIALSFIPGINLFKPFKGTRFITSKKILCKLFPLLFILEVDDDDSPRYRL